MHIQDPILWRRATDFLTSCKEKRVHIIHDSDMDGIAGGLLLLHTLERIGANPSSSTRGGRGTPLHPDAYQDIPDMDALIITDLDPKSFHLYRQLRDALPTTPLLIIDHHHVSTYDDALFIHPLLLYGTPGHQYCSAKLVFDLCSAVTDVADLSWLTVAGILGDANAKYFPEFLASAAKQHDVTLPADPYESLFAAVPEAVDCCAAKSEEDLLRYVEPLARCQTLQDAIALGNPCEEVKEEVQKYLDEGLDTAIITGAVVWLPIESEFAISSKVTTLLSMQYPHRILAGYREQTDGYHVNLRFQDASVHLGEIMKSLAPLGVTGGGHAPAAGGWVPKHAWQQFQTAFQSVVEQQLSSSID